MDMDIIIPVCPVKKHKLRKIKCLMQIMKECVAQLKLELTSSDHYTVFPVRPPKAKLEELWVSNNAKTFQTHSYLTKYIFFPHKGDPRSGYSLWGAVFLKKLYSYLLRNCIQMIHLNQDKWIYLCGGKKWLEIKQFEAKSFYQLYWMWCGCHCRTEGVHTQSHVLRLQGHST